MPKQKPKEPFFENVDVRGDAAKPPPPPEPIPLPEYEQQTLDELRQLRRRHEDQVTRAKYAKSKIKLVQVDLRRLPDAAHKALDELAEQAPATLEATAQSWLSKLTKPDPPPPPPALASLRLLADKKTLVELHALIDNAAANPNNGAISGADRGDLEAEIKRQEKVIAEAEVTQQRFTPKIAELHARAAALRDGRVRGGVRTVASNE